MLAQPVVQRVQGRAPVESVGAGKDNERASARRVWMHAEVLATLEVDEQAGRDVGTITKRNFSPKVSKKVDGKMEKVNFYIHYEIDEART